MGFCGQALDGKPVPVVMEQMFNFLQGITIILLANGRCKVPRSVVCSGLLLTPSSTNSSVSVWEYWLSSWLAHIHTYRHNPALRRGRLPSEPTEKRTGNTEGLIDTDSRKIRAVSLCLLQIPNWLGSDRTRTCAVRHVTARLITVNIQVFWDVTDVSVECRVSETSITMYRSIQQYQKLRYFT